jgi:antitoxin component YwqK of YwqJK toxin-antitoxin module
MEPVIENFTNFQKKLEYYLLVGGKHDGKEIWWYSSGQKRFEYCFVNGMKNGKETRWDESKHIREINIYMNDTEIISFST